MLRDLLLVALLSIVGSLGAAFCGCDLPVAAVVGSALALLYGLKRPSPAV